MGIKDTFVSLYVKKFVIPGALVLDKPGFVNFNVSGKTPMFARQVIIPETFFVNLETMLIAKFGNKGKQILYSTGKKFGYRFALIGNFMKKGDASNSEIAEYIGIVSKFVEGTYASKISGKFDVANSKVEYDLNNFVIISKLDRGYFLPNGGTAGLISRLLNDKTIEVVDTGINGNHHLICMQEAKLSELKYNYLTETDLDGLDLEEEYAARNQVKDYPKDATSFKQLLDSKYFSYADGIIRHGEERYFLLEVSAWYLIEKELAKYDGAMQILEAASRETGARLLSTNTTNELARILTATGWGNPQILLKKGKVSLILTTVPWTKFYKEVNFAVLRGLLEGMLSKIHSREVMLNAPSVDLTQISLTLLFEEA